MTSTNDIRRSFLDYFEGQGHARVPSAPLVPHNDPTLMFVNAGMVPFKNVFTGLESRPYSTAVESEMRPRRRQAQRPRQCRLHRAPPHLLRNARQFLVRRLFQGAGDRPRLDPAHPANGASSDRLTVTVYHTDDQAADLWRKIAGLPDRPHHPHRHQGQFLGDGPRRPERALFGNLLRPWRPYPGGPPGSPDEDGDRFVEIWNLVFMQYLQEDDVIVSDLPKPSIDTGMGLERVAAVMQGVHDNYDTDTFKALIAAAKN